MDLGFTLGAHLKNMPAVGPVIRVHGQRRVPELVAGEVVG